MQRITVPGQLFPREYGDDVSRYLARRYPWAAVADYPTLFPGWCYLDSGRLPWHHRLFVPIIQDEELISFVARDLGGIHGIPVHGRHRPRYMSGPNAGKDGVLYQPNAGEPLSGLVWLVEGCFDTPAVVGAGFDVVATLGSHFYPAQLLELTKRLAAPAELVVAWDRDKLGDAWTLVQHLRDQNFTAYLGTDLLPDDQDLGDLTPDWVTKAAQLLTGGFA